MDIFFEQIVKRKKTTADRVMASFIIISAALLILVMLLIFITGVFGGISRVFLLTAILSGYLTYRTLSGHNIEFEYSITNGCLDIDEIRAKKKRRRLLTTECSSFEEFGEYASKKFKERDFDCKLMAANKSGELYYAVFRHKTRGRTLLIIEPNDKILGAVKRFLPRALKIRNRV